MSTPSPSAASNLARWLRTQTPTSPSLSYCHTTDMWRFRSIVELGYLSPVRCKVFEEDLVYFFYGRPAYRREADPIVTSPKAPVVLVLHPTVLKLPQRVFPFDTGAFPKRFARWLVHGMELRHFQLDADARSPPRHVSAFFLSNRNYLNCDAKTQPTASGAEVEAETLFRIYNDTTSTDDVDDRRHAVEVQINSSIPLHGSHILAIILPTQCLDHEFIRTFRATTGGSIEFLGYELNRHKNSKEYQQTLEDQSTTLQAKRGML